MASSDSTSLQIATSPTSDVEGEVGPAPPSVVGDEGVSGNGGYKFVSTPSGTIVPVPEDWSFRLTDNERGSVYQDPASIGTNANMIRIMDPKVGYPQGYVV